MKSLSVVAEMKPTEQYFGLALFVSQYSAAEICNFLTVSNC